MILCKVDPCRETCTNASKTLGRRRTEKTLTTIQLCYSIYKKISAHHYIVAKIAYTNRMYFPEEFSCDFRGVAIT